MNRLKKLVTFNNDLTTNSEYFLDRDSDSKEPIAAFNLYSYAITNANDFFKLNNEEYMQTIKPLMDSLPRELMTDSKMDDIIAQSKLLAVDYNDALFVTADNSLVKLEWNENLRDLLNIETSTNYNVVTDAEKIFPEHKSMNFESTSSEEFESEYNKRFEGEFLKEFNKECLISAPLESQGETDSTYSINIYNNSDKKMMTVTFDSEINANKTYEHLLAADYKDCSSVAKFEDCQAEIKEMIIANKGEKILIENFDDISIIRSGNDSIVCKIETLENSTENTIKTSMDNLLSKTEIENSSIHEIDKDRTKIKIVEDLNEYYLYDKNALSNNQDGNLGKIVFINQSGSGKNNELTILTTNEDSFGAITEFQISLSDNEFKKILDGESMKKSEMKQELSDINDFCLNKYSFKTNLDISSETDISNLEIRDNKFFGNIGTNEEATKLSIEKIAIDENNNITVTMGKNIYQVVSINQEFENLDKFRESVKEATNNSQLSLNESAIATYIDYCKDSSVSPPDKYLMVTTEDGKSIKINTNDIKTKDDDLGVLIYADNDGLKTIYTNFKQDEYVMDSFLNKNIGTQDYAVHKITNIDVDNKILILKTDEGHDMIKLTPEFEALLEKNDYPISGHLSNAFLSSEPKFDYGTFKDVSLETDRTYVESQSVIAKPVVDAPTNGYVVIEVEGNLKLFAKREEKIFGESTSLAKLLEDDSHKILNYENLRDKIEFAFIPDKPSLEKLAEMMSEPDFKIKLDEETKKIVISCGKDENEISDTISTVELCERQYIKATVKEEEEYEHSSNRDAELDL